MVSERSCQGRQGLPNRKLIELFNTARGKEYAALCEQVRALTRLAKGEKVRTDSVERIRKQFREIRRTDFFNSVRAEGVEMLLRRIEKTQPLPAFFPRVHRRDYQKKIWVTRPRPEIDRVGSAWLIRKLIDPKAKFAFSKTVPADPYSVSFDMVGANFTHRGDDCTFETLVKDFQIHDKAAQEIAEMIHDADLDDDKFERNECIGIDRVLKGWARAGLPDQEILRRGFQCFDALYTFLR